MKKKRIRKPISNSQDSHLQVIESNGLTMAQNQTNLFFNNMRTLLAQYSNTGIGVTHNGARDLYTILGYKKQLEFSDYLWRYQRQDIATRIVNAFPGACWSLKPSVLESDTPNAETAFETAFQKLAIDKKVFHYLTRVDKISGIGRFGVLFLGFADGRKADQPVRRGGNVKLQYLKPYHEGSVTIQSYDEDTTSERFGLPKEYKITVALPSITNTNGSETYRTTEITVHHERVIHVVPELATENDIFGSPRLENVYNRIQDLDSIAGGGTEMTWRGAFTGMAFKNDEGAVMSDEGKQALTSEINNYINNMERFIKLQNMDVKELSPTQIDPTAIFDIEMTLISAAKEIPKRILLGSEAGELASSQDENNWNRKVDERRIDHSEMMILRPFIDRLIDVGVLPKPKDYKIVWPDLYSPSGLDQAKIAEAQMRALKDYLTMPEGQIVVPHKVFRQTILNFTEAEDNQCEAIVDDMSQSEIDDILADENDEADNNSGNINADIIPSE